jgi:hypothetical protein
MPKFMDVHSGLKGVTEDQLREAHRSDQEIERQKGEEGVEFQKWWADPENGKVFCLIEGPNKEAVRRVHERAGNHPDEIFELRHSG